MTGINLFVLHPAISVFLEMSNYSFDWLLLGQNESHAYALMLPRSEKSDQVNLFP